MKTIPDQECGNGNQVIESHNVAGLLLQAIPRAEDLLTAQDTPMPVVKLPLKDQHRECLECCSNDTQQSVVKSSTVSKKGGSGEVTSKVHSRTRSNEKSSFDRSLPDTSSDITHFPLPLERSGPDETKITGYSGLHWDPQTNFWGYYINERAWTDSVQTSDGNTSDHSVRPNFKYDVFQNLMIIQIFSSSIASSSRSSLTEEAPDPMGTDQHRPTLKHPPPKHSEFCRNWLLNRCQLGYCCLYVHGDLEYDPPVKGRHPPPLYPEVCRKWLRNQCIYGYACHFVHDDLEYDSLTPVKETLKTSGNLTTVVGVHL
jgi:hypothetical protein